MDTSDRVIRECFAIREAMLEGLIRQAREDKARLHRRALLAEDRVREQDREIERLKYELGEAKWRVGDLQSKLEDARRAA